MMMLLLPKIDGFDFGGINCCCCCPPAADSTDHVEAVAGLEGRVDDLDDDLDAVDDRGVALPGRDRQLLKPSS